MKIFLYLLFCGVLYILTFGVMPSLALFAIFPNLLIVGLIVMASTETSKTRMLICASLFGLLLDFTFSTVPGAFAVGLVASCLVVQIVAGKVILQADRTKFLPLLLLLGNTLTFLGAFLLNLLAKFFELTLVSFSPKILLLELVVGLLYHFIFLIPIYFVWVGYQQVVEGWLSKRRFGT